MPGNTMSMDASASAPTLMPGMTTLAPALLGAPAALAPESGEAKATKKVATPSRPPDTQAARGGPPLAAGRANWTPSLTLPQQQALLARAIQACKAQNHPSFTPVAALAQLGYVFVRLAQLPVVPTMHLPDGVVLRLDEASTLGVLPTQLEHLGSHLPGVRLPGAGAGATPGLVRPAAPPAEPAPLWPALVHPVPGKLLVDGGAPPTTSAVGQPVTPQNTHLTRLSRAEAESWVDLPASDVNALRSLMEKDAQAAKQWEKQSQAMQAELYTRMAQVMRPHRPLTWWEKSAMPDAPPARTEPLQLVYPAQRAKPQEAVARSARSASAGRIASMPATLVPIRLDLEHEPFKYRDTFVWNAADDEAALEAFALTLCDDVGLPPQVFVELIKSAVQLQVSEYATSLALQVVAPEREEQRLGRGCLDADAERMWAQWRSAVLHEGAAAPAPPAWPEPNAEGAQPAEARQDELRILIKLDILVGGVHLLDQFEWDLQADDQSAEHFAAAFASDLGLAGEFTTAIAHAIREQVSGHWRWLALLGYPYNQLTSLDRDVRDAFLPTLAPQALARARESIDAFTPKLVQLSAADVLQMEREHERDLRRKRRQTKGRRGAPVEAYEPQRTLRSVPLWGFQGAMPEAERPVHARRAAAAAAASLAAQTGLRDATPPTEADGTGGAGPVAKRMKTEWYDMYFRYPGGLGGGRRATPRFCPGGAGPWAHMPQTPWGAHGAAIGTAALSLPAGQGAHTATTAGHDVARMVPREPAGPMRGVRPEDLERQQPTMHEGVWHCANCGVPGLLTAARRKGPAGEKTLCGPCGKYFHRHRRVPSVAYTRDATVHQKRLGLAVAPPAASQAPSHEAEADALPVHDLGTPLASDSDEDVATAPTWLLQAVEACRAKYTHDRFEVLQRARPAEGPADGDRWRIRCFDCPGKVYKPGPGESLANFEIHLKNRSHRAAVAKRLPAAPEALG
ncbi:SWI/SNF chromatin-remodeling complex subunit [Malassezia equina]|uniref:SWI/SNF chromatin-remodeling complex subunit n=1 Tax=Malassezia equina TaxID=1381935 RepID=A0AAF0EHF5_9BASI|nr:SWI/SNF chromatin-remodeling complex subunit [Malassezia equina]